MLKACNVSENNTVAIFRVYDFMCGLGKLLLVLASMVILGFGPYRDL
jgi:hypothetical protein